MKFTFLVILTFLTNFAYCNYERKFLLFDTKDSCILKFVDKVIKYKTSYLSIPATLASDNRKVKVVMESQVFLSYLRSCDSLYQDNEYLKSYLANLFLGKTKFVFYKSVCIIKNLPFVILPEKNYYYSDINNQPILFLKKVLANYDSQKIEFNLSFQFPEQRFYEVISGLFDLGFLVVEGDGNFIAQRTNYCL